MKKMIYPQIAIHLRIPSDAINMACESDTCCHLCLIGGLNFGFGSVDF